MRHLMSAQTPDIDKLKGSRYTPFASRTGCFGPSECPLFTTSGVVVQLVRTPACHAGGREFESRRPRHLFEISRRNLLETAADGPGSLRASGPANLRACGEELAGGSRRVAVPVLGRPDLTRWAGGAQSCSGPIPRHSEKERTQDTDRQHRRGNRDPADRADPAGLVDTTVLILSPASAGARIVASDLLSVGHDSPPSGL